MQIVRTDHRRPINITTMHHIIIAVLAPFAPPLSPPSQTSLRRLFSREFKRVVVNGVDTLKMEIIHGCLRALLGLRWVYEIYIDTAEIIESLLWRIWISPARCGKMGRVPVTDINNGTLRTRTACLHQCLNCTLLLQIRRNKYICIFKLWTFLR